MIFPAVDWPKILSFGLFRLNVASQDRKKWDLFVLDTVCSRKLSGLK